MFSIRFLAMTMAAGPALAADFSKCDNMPVTFLGLWPTLDPAQQAAVTGAGFNESFWNFAQSGACIDTLCGGSNNFCASGRVGTWSETWGDYDAAGQEFMTLIGYGPEPVFNAAVECMAEWCPMVVNAWKHVPDDVLFWEPFEFLTAEQQDAAVALGYTAYTWDLETSQACLAPLCNLGGATETDLSKVSTATCDLSELPPLALISDYSELTEEQARHFATLGGTKANFATAFLPVCEEYLKEAGTCYHLVSGLPCVASGSTGRRNLLFGGHLDTDSSVSNDTDSSASNCSCH